MKRNKALTDISNELGKIFRGHNILEYKSPEDHLDIDVFYKTTAYACLYKAYGKTLDEIKEDREFADSVLEVSVRANMQIAEELRGDVSMCQALMEIMEPEIRLIEEERWKAGEEEGRRVGQEEGRREGRKEGRKEGILGTVKVLRNFGQSNAEIKSIIMETYRLTEKEAEDCLHSTLE